MKKINKISIVHKLDTNPDLDWIGTFDNEAKHPFAIDREQRGDMERGQYRYFNPQEGACETKEQAEQNYRRIMEFERGDWHMLGISAQAEIATSENGATWTINTIRSGGLWGVESDSDEATLNEIGSEQLEELTDILIELGFSKDEIAKIELSTLFR